jgi:sterol desaturase/sphingolipid hydroxylase (fatty acid hydroxylase superfamily)
VSSATPDERRRKRLGRRWLPGIVSVFLGALGLLAVLCLHFPALLTTPELRAVYPMVLVRTAIATGLGAAIVLGALALLADRGRRLGTLGLALALAAQLAGGADVEVATPVPPRSHLGLDWFVLDLLLLVLVFVPLERAFARLPAQPVFRRGWRTDLAHFFASHLLVQVTSLLTIAPALLFFRWASHSSLQEAVAAQPTALQALEVLAVADLAGYAAHRAFHAVPWLWRFHAVHHSSPAMDWLAGSRLHLFDAVATRAAVFVPLFVLGFERAALSAYLVWVSFQATWIHANLRGGPRWLDHVLATPRFHHWHHAADAEARDRNFAVHLPVIDWLFGTRYLPSGRWPERYGVDGEAVPDGWLRQLAWPLRVPPPTSPSAAP